MQNPILFSKKSTGKSHMSKKATACVCQESVARLNFKQNFYSPTRTITGIFARSTPYWQESGWQGLVSAPQDQTRRPCGGTSRRDLKKKKKIRAHPLPDKNSAEYRGAYSQRLESIYPRLQWWVHDTDPRPSKGWPEQEQEVLLTRIL